MREIPIILDPLVPKDTMYMLNPTHLRPPPDYDGLLRGALIKYTEDLERIVVGPRSPLMRLLIGDPWDTPDRNPIPKMILCPRVERARLRLVLMRERITQAWDVLWNGLPPDIEEW